MDKAVLGEKAWPWYRNLMIGGLIAIIVAVVSAAIIGDWGRLGFAYLIGYAFALAITLGSLFFVLVTTVFRAGWCVAFRRIPETIAANMPVMGVLAIPILITVLLNNGALYPWAATNSEGQTIHEVGKKMAGYDKAKAAKVESHSSLSDQVLLQRIAADAPEADHGDHDGHDHADHAEAGHDGHAHGEHDDHAEAGHGDEHHGEAHHGDGHHGDHHAWTHTAETWGDHSHATPYYTYKKGAWYTPVFFVLRWIGYIAIWSFIARFYWKRSLMQDADGDVIHTHKREWWAPMSLLAFAITITLGAFDLLMSLDPVWYSTMFGVYFFAGCFTTAICTMIITIMLGQRAGYFPSVTTEHLHDLGKLLFAFVFFWGYVGFSQFMLIWYASLPETTYWWEIRGVTSSVDAPTFGSGWTNVAWALLFGHLLLPFAILLSKHVKRNRTALFIMACWMLTICYIDIFWVAMPAYLSPEFAFGLPEIGCVVFCVAVMLATALQRAKRHSLAAHNDPRMHESLALDTSAWAPLYH